MLRISHFAPLAWDLAPFAHVSNIDSGDHLGFGPPTRFAFRYLRYWFMYNYLMALHARTGRPLEDCEVGVHNGQMLAFMGGTRNGDALTRPPAVAGWTAVDINLDEGKLRAIIGETLPLAQVAEGHRRLEERGVFGKVVLVPDKKTEASHGG